MIYLGKVLTTWRWQAMLNAQGIHAPFFWLMASVFVGQFLNSLLVGNIDAYHNATLSWRIGRVDLAGTYYDSGFETAHPIAHGCSLLAYGEVEM